MSINSILNKNEYLSQVSILMTGSIFAQAITILSSPVLTRMYSPDSFGILAILLSIIGAISPGISGRYETAIIVAKEYSDRLKFMFIAVWFTLSLSIIVLASIIAIKYFDLMPENIKQIKSWIWIVPLWLFLIGISTILHSWANSVNDYVVISKSVVFQNLTVALMSVVIGIFYNGNVGLIFSNILGAIVIVTYLFITYKSLFTSINWHWSADKIKLAIANKDYPLFNGVTSMLNGIMSGLPVFFLAAFFSESIVGQYALIMRIGVSPLRFISDAVSRVNFKKVADLLNNKQDPIPYIIRITLFLTGIISIIGIPLSFYATDFIGFIFGENWRAAGQFLVILMPALAVQFVVSTLSISFVATGRLRLLSIWQFLSLIFTVIVFSYFGMQGDIIKFFIAYMIKDIFMYGLYYAAFIYALKNPKFHNI